MTIVEKRKREALMVDMRRKGMTLREIADDTGLSYQQVFADLKGCGIDGYFRAFTPKKCIYPNLRRWLNENRVTTKELCLRMYGNDLAANRQSISRFMKGYAVDISKSVIDRYISATGMTYEELFEKEKEA